MKRLLRLPLIGSLILVGLVGCSRSGIEQILFHTGGETVDAQIYLVDLNGQNLKQLTDSRGANASPAWSPDGNQIAFVSTRETNFEIYIMNADGSGEYNFTVSRADDRSPAWSPDGKWILFESRKMDMERRDLYIKHVDTGELIQLTDTKEVSELSPAWSPDGSQIAYAAGDENNLDIYIMDKDSLSVENLTEDFGNANYPIWDPSGEIVYFVVFEGFETWTSQIFAYDIQSGEIRQVSFDDEFKEKIVVTPDGMRLLFDSFVEIDNKENDGFLARSVIYSMNINGTGLELLPIEIGANGVALRP